MIRATIYNDPACPWGYSANPALRVIEWRYGAQLEWRLVLIGLTESAQQYVDRGYTPLRSALGQLRFRRYGMPFSPVPKQRVSATARACRAVVAARIDDPGSEWRVFRAIQFANFTTELVLEDDAQLAKVVGEQIVARLDDPDVTEAYERDRVEARTAAGSATELQGKAANSDGLVRYTAPSLVVERDGVKLEAGGFQPAEAYDVVVANIDPTLERRDPPEDPRELLAYFPDGLTTQEVAALLTHGNDAPDRQAAESALLAIVGSGDAVREPLGDDALWRAPAYASRAANAA
ncbi:MAG TPA: DsbA family protein [Gaiellaceae bacterium]|nr:DsbA family protein [Gaiellaceae bacterium]